MNNATTTYNTMLSFMVTTHSTDQQCLLRVKTSILTMVFPRYFSEKCCTVDQPYLLQYFGKKCLTICRLFYPAKILLHTPAKIILPSSARNARFVDSFIRETYYFALLDLSLSLLSGKILFSTFKFS
jgi:hypothetical protein